MLGDERLRLAIHEVLPRAVEVALGDGTILEWLRREEVVDEAMLLDEPLGDDPEDLRPNLADSVHAPVSRLVEGLVGRRVNGLILQMTDVNFWSLRRR